MIVKTRMALAAGLGLSLTAGCNASVTTDPPGSGGSGVTTTVGATTAASTGASTGSGGSCSGFDDAKSPATVSIRFHNETSIPVYLPVQCSTIQYTIKRLSSDDLVNYTFDPSCLQTCFELQTQAGFECGACAPTSYLIPAGGTREIAWNATGLTMDIPMPAACYFQPQSSECQKIVSASPDKYGITALGFNSCGVGCTCDATGLCTGSAEGAQAQADPVTFGFPGESAVDVTFSVCAFGCPGGK
jgi:hypothetical protein